MFSAKERQAETRQSAISAALTLEAARRTRRSRL